jgi:ribonuclease PH
MKRKDGRRKDQLRPVEFMLDFIEYPEGSVLISLGKTKVLCNVSVESVIPEWIESSDLPGGWITAEYALLPRSTTTRVKREVGSLSGRTQEIRRLIGRCLRAGFDLTLLGRRTFIVDCDVLQADGGTRTASITGGYVALCLAIRDLIDQGLISEDVYLPPVAAISVGILSGEPILDLDYSEDAQAETDLNVVMNQLGEFIEIQGTAEGATFSRENLDSMLEYAKQGIQQLIDTQVEAIK